MLINTCCFKLNFLISLVLTNDSWPVIYILSCLDSRGCMFLVQSPSLFIFHHMALLMMQSLINHNTISWANQLNTNSTYQTTGSFAEFNCKIHWNFHSAHYTHYIHSLQNKSWAISKTGNCCHRYLLFKYFLILVHVKNDF